MFFYHKEYKGLYEETQRLGPSLCSFAFLLLVHFVVKPRNKFSTKHALYEHRLLRCTLFINQFKNNYDSEDLFQDQELLQSDIQF